MQRPARLKAFAVVTHGPEEWSLKIIPVFCEIEIITDTLCNLGLQALLAENLR